MTEKSKLISTGVLVELNQALSGFEGTELRQVALEYLKIRKACMQPVFKPRREREL